MEGLCNHKLELIAAQIGLASYRLTITHLGSLTGLMACRPTVQQL